jgi:hypothetical protein
MPDGVNNSMFTLLELDTTSVPVDALMRIGVKAVSSNPVLLGPIQDQP